MALETGDVVLCTVDRIVGTVVFVKIDKENKEGSIIMSEIAPGRIRNLRDYVVPKKKIACKIIRISDKNIDLSLRRVTQKEKKEVLEKDEKEKAYLNILKSVLKEKADKTIKEISKKEDIIPFLEESKENPEKLEQLIGKKDAGKILEILKTQKIKKVVIKKIFFLTTTELDGLEKIKSLTEKIKDFEIKYLSAGKYSIKTESENAKEADNKLKEFLAEIEKKAKEKNISFATEEK